MSQETSSSVLRLYGPSPSEVKRIVKQAADEGCPGLNLLMKNGEYAVFISARAQTKDAAVKECNLWRRRLHKMLGSCVFSTDGSGLGESTVKLMAGAGRLFVSADDVTGQLLNGRMRELENSGAVYDFGAQSYAHPRKADKVRPDRRLMKKYPRQPVQKAVGQARSARKVSEADWAVCYRPAASGDPAYVFVCGKKQIWLRVLPIVDDMEEMAAGCLLDLLRRLTEGTEMDPEVLVLTYGREIPPLLPRVKVWDEAAAARQKHRPGQTAAPAVSAEEMKKKARLLFEEEAVPEPPRTEVRTRWDRVILSLLAVVLVTGSTLLCSGYHTMLADSRSAANQLGGRGYGTADYDMDAGSLLAAAMEQDETVAAYLALPRMAGSLVYTVNAAQPVQTEQRSGPAAEKQVRLGNEVSPGQPCTNLLISCPKEAMRRLGELDQIECLSQNSGFTLYTPEQTFRYKTTAVFYWDPFEQGETALDLMQMQDLSDYQTYLEFVLGIKARSLFELPADMRDGDSFATLVADASDRRGMKLVITGRLLRENEAAILFGKQIGPADEPLMPLVSYPQGSAPAMDMLKQYWLNWYQTGGATSSEVQSEAGMPQTDRPVETVQPAATPGPEATAAPEATEQPTVQPTKGPGAGPTDVPILQPTAAPSARPTAAPTQVPAKPTQVPAKPQPTPAPTQVPAKPQPTAAPTQMPVPVPTLTASPAPTQAPNPQPTPAPTPEGRTIRVTMNGVTQEMNLAECLAMVARNEMGPNAPDEAYKAQMVATHSWILSQGGAPSVSGRQPGSHLLELAKQVEGQVLTYNGSIAFTPYFASAAFGTSSSQDVWGGYRPYLVAVDSPYDKEYSKNWQNTRIYYRAEVAARGLDRLGIDLEAYSSDPTTWFGDAVKNSSGYVLTIRMGDQTITGGRLQTKVLNNVNGKTLRSTAFDVVYDPELDAFRFTTYGYGHGCGLSQMGAWGYARNGWGYAEILAHYYPGTVLSSI